MERPDKNEGEELDRLFAAYRDACPDVEGPANFLPGIWAAIEAASPLSWVFPLRRWAARLAVAAGAAAVLLIGYTSFVQPSSNIDVLEASYVDALTMESLDEEDADFWLMSRNQR